MIDSFFILLTSAIGQLNTIGTLQPVRTIVLSTPLINIVTRPITRRTTIPTTSTTIPTTSTTIPTTSTIVSTTTSTITSTITQESVLNDYEIIGLTWGLVAFIFMMIGLSSYCARRRQLQPIEPESLDYVHQDSFSSHIYEEPDENPYEMPVIMEEEEPYGERVTAL